MHPTIRTFVKAGTVASLLAFLAACDDSSVNAPESISASAPEENKPAVAGAPLGVQAVPSTRSVAQTIDALEQAVGANAGSSVVARIDHQGSARTADIDIPPTVLLLISNPAIDAALMQKNQQVGLDLPQKMLAFEDPQGSVKLAFNGVDYLQGRYGLGDLDVLTALRSNLDELAASAGGSEVGPHQKGTKEVEEGEGVVVVSSANDFETSYEKLKQAVEAQGAMKIVAEIDHAADAAGADMSLSPTRLLIFGNPKVGSPMIKARQSIALDLPQKMLVYQDREGEVFVAYNDPKYISRRHDMIEPGQQQQNEQIEAVASVLAGLANAAVAPDGAAAE